ncbi:hypothetical protein BsWGS_18449 [Bradybaena similaris]
MFFALLHVIALFSSLMIKAQKIAVNVCSSGWFGKGCVFQCHCSATVTCGAEGECPKNGKCLAGYFGPACQYVDYNWNTTEGNDQYLIDEDEGTCNNHKDATDVTILFPHGIVLTWFRLYVNNPSVLHNFSVLLDALSPCYNERRFAVSQTGVDVSCDVDNIVSSLSLKGPVAPHVCSVYVSKGRNVALRQPANQSSTFNERSAASRAVDGIRTPISSSYCTHTLNESYVAEWSLYFSRPYSVYSVAIYNTAEFPERLVNFTLLTFNEKGNVTNRWTEDAKMRQYVLQMNSRAPIVAIKIRQFHAVKDQNAMVFRTLSLCEVEAYGEALCPDAYYGLACDKKCRCKISETCFTVTGECAPGCPIGEYGAQCAGDCNPECQTGFCYQRLGICESCNPGFSGAYCTKECDDGKYGLGCNKSCSVYCDNVCNKRTGSCKCRTPYKGNDCTECEPGTYGVNCSKTCPTDCEDITCDLETGKCLSCNGYRMGDLCNECPEKTYGSLCSSNCSVYCQNGTCDPNDGTCPNCVSGYSGPRCNRAPLETRLWMLLIIAAIIVSFLAALACCFLLFKLREKFAEADAESFDSDTQTNKTSTIISERSYL